MNLPVVVGVAFAWAGLISMAITALVVRWGRKLKIVDDPKVHLHPKVVHSKPVPRGGGIPIYLAVMGGLVLFLPVDARLIGVIMAASMLAVVGFLDDRFEESVSPYVRLVVNLAAALIVVLTGTGIFFVTSPLGGVIDLNLLTWCMAGGCYSGVVILISVMWLVWMQNMVGWSSGVDGQLPGFVIIAAVVLGILGLRFGADPQQYQVIVLAAITAGAYLGFLVFNWWPQKIMPGYGGKSLGGFLLGVIAILSGAKVGALLLVLAIPMIDAVWVIIKRLKEGRSPVWGGREHLHHYLLAMGWTKQSVALFYLLVSAVFGFFAISLQAPSKYFTIALIVLVISAVLIWLHYFSTYLKRPDRDSG